MIRPQCTKRFHIDVGHKCNINCKFCYHRHEGDLRNGRFQPYEWVMSEVQAGVERGNTWLDFTGGEPTMFPNVSMMIDTIKKKYPQLGITIITNGIVNNSITERLLSVGLDEFLVSIHGMTKIHNFLTAPKTREHQIEFLERIVGRIKLRFNCVINQFNQDEIVEVAQWMSLWKPSIVNFINFNPHHGWTHELKEAENVIAGLYIVQPQLEQAIHLLEEVGIGVNLRYYPMCRIKEEYRRCVCNDLHVVYDPCEWDYGIAVKQPEKFFEWAYNATNLTEMKTAPCGICDLQWICGGINKYFLEITGEQVVSPITHIDFKDMHDRFDFYHYRKDNTLTIDQHKVYERPQNEKSN